MYKTIAVLILAFSNVVWAKEMTILPGDLEKYVIAPDRGSFIYLDRDNGNVLKHEDDKVIHLDMANINYSRDTYKNFSGTVSPTSKYLALKFYESESLPVIAIIDLNDFRVLKKIPAGNLYWIDDDNLILFKIFAGPFSVEKGLQRYSVESDEIITLFPEVGFTGSFKASNNLMIAETIDRSNSDFLFQFKNIVIDLTDMKSGQHLEQ